MPFYIKPYMNIIINTINFSLMHFYFIQPKFGLYRWLEDVLYLSKFVNPINFAYCKTMACCKCNKYGTRDKGWGLVFPLCILSSFLPLLPSIWVTLFFLCVSCPLIISLSVVIALQNNSEIFLKGPLKTINLTLVQVSNVTFHLH